MKRILIIDCICLLLLTLMGCVLNYTFDRVVGVTQACYAIPGACLVDAHLKPYAECIDVDEYGRRLYGIRINDNYGIRAVCIAQKADNEFVYYYDNVNYFCLPIEDGYTEHEITALKLKNDWGLELKEERMIKRRLHSKRDLFPAIEFLNFENCKEVFEQNVSIPQDGSMWLRACDISKTEQELYLVSIFKTDGSTEPPTRSWYKHYLVIINRDGTYNPDTFMVSFDDLNKSNGPLAEIKQKNNWQG